MEPRKVIVVQKDLPLPVYLRHEHIRAYIKGFFLRLKSLSWPGFQGGDLFRRRPDCLLFYSQSLGNGAIAALTQLGKKSLYDLQGQRGRLLFSLQLQRQALRQVPRAYARRIQGLKDQHCLV